MRIGIYVDVAKEKEPRGVGYHILSLVTALSKIDCHNEYILYYQHDLFGQTEKNLPFPKVKNFRERPIRFPQSWIDSHPTLWWKYYLPFITRRDRIDVFHGPNHFVPAIQRNKSIVTIHDVAYFKMDLYSEGITAALKHWTLTCLNWAGFVIAISKNTYADLEGLGVDPRRLRLIYGGGNIVPDDQIEYHRKDELRRLFCLPERYIVFVGTLAVRKNLQFLLRSYAELKKANPNLQQKLVLVGKPFTGFEVLEELIDELNIKNDVIITGYVEAWQIPLFYKMADLFVLPTLYEGFTLTTIEAMAYGTPVIATDTSSIREGVGDAAVLVPVDDVVALTEKMQLLLEDDKVRQSYKEAGYEQAQKFTWERCARETLALYEESFASLK